VKALIDKDGTLDYRNENDREPRVAVYPFSFYHNGNTHIQLFIPTKSLPYQSAKSTEYTIVNL